MRLHGSWRLRIAFLGTHAAVACGDSVVDPADNEDWAFCRMPDCRELVELGFRFAGDGTVRLLHVPDAEDFEANEAVYCESGRTIGVHQSFAGGRVLDIEPESGEPVRGFFEAVDDVAQLTRWAPDYEVFGALRLSPVNDLGLCEERPF